MSLPLVTIAILLTAPAFAQDATVLLQRGIFLEETAGDLDGAIRVYRQILSAGPQARAYQARAQDRLRDCLARKNGVKPPADAVPSETHYVDPSSGYSFTVPSGWSLTPRLPVNGGGGMCVEAVDPARKWTVTICGRSQGTLASDIDAQLSKGASAMLETRKHRFPDFTPKPGNPFFGSLAGQRTLSMMASYTARNEPYAAWIVWVQTEKTRVSLSAGVPAAELPAFYKQFTPILASFRAP
jgi:hypothetical protein